MHNWGGDMKNYICPKGKFRDNKKKLNNGKSWRANFLFCRLCIFRCLYQIQQRCVVQYILNNPVAPVTHFMNFWTYVVSKLFYFTSFAIYFFKEWPKALDGCRNTLKTKWKLSYFSIIFFKLDKSEIIGGANLS